MRNVNDDELVDLVEFGRRVNAEVRFIEYMDVGGATRWHWGAVVTRAEMLARLTAHYGPLTPVVEESTAPAERFTLPDGTAIGLISSTTAPFCRSCDRARLTADGLWLLCLYATTGLDLRTPLRTGMSDEQLLALVLDRWSRPERPRRRGQARGGSEECACPGRGAEGAKPSGDAHPGGMTPQRRRIAASHSCVPPMRR